MTPAPTAAGRSAERLAESYLAGRGLATLARNHRCPGGEIDLVMQDGATLVFVEVRLRAHPGFGGAAGSVDRRKQARIARCAEHYLQRHRGAGDCDCRFDVVALRPDGEQYDVSWIRDAFTL